jgi:hypothetical protein
MAVTVRANLKDENYFAKAASWTTRARAAGANGPPNRENGRLAGLFHERKGMRERLLFLAGKSSLAQLPERHFAAHRLTIGSLA